MSGTKRKRDTNDSEETTKSKRSAVKSKDEYIYAVVLEEEDKAGDREKTLGLFTDENAANECVWKRVDVLSDHEENLHCMYDVDEFIERLDEPGSSWSLNHRLGSVGVSVRKQKIVTIKKRNKDTTKKTEEDCDKAREAFKAKFMKMMDGYM